MRGQARSSSLLSVAKKRNKLMLPRQRCLVSSEPSCQIAKNNFCWPILSKKVTELRQE